MVIRNQSSWNRKGIIYWISIFPADPADECTVWSHQTYLVYFIKDKPRQHRKRPSLR